MYFGSGRARLAAMLLSAIVFTAACGSDPAPPPPTPSTSALPPPLFTNWPAEANEFRFHWAAAPGIDLETGPAVALRAYVESYRLAGFAGGDHSVVYPGFMRATPESTGPQQDPDSLVQLWDVRPETRAGYEADGLKYVQRQVYGYQPTYILNLAPQGDGYRATVCLGLYSVYRTDDNDRSRYFSTVADPETGQPQRYGDSDGVIEIWRVELTDKDPRVGNVPVASAVPQRGPLPAPVDDVFGRWFITGNSLGLWGPLGDSERIDTPEVRKQCQDVMPDDAAARMAMATGFHTEPPPHGEPIPGWPAENR